MEETIFGLTVTMSEKAAQAAIKLRSVPVTMDLAKGKNSSEIAKAAHFTEEDFCGASARKSVPLYVKVLHEHLGLAQDIVS